MQNITLRELQITNFKGIKSLHLTFNAEGETNIYGANGSGKSSIFDAFTWLLFGKDSQDRKDFDIKNTVETELNRQDHEVCAVLEINGINETIKRIFREKWVKRMGSEVREMQGNETLYFWNEVPLQAGEFKAKVESIAPESIFKLLTNALYFNQMKWTERRRIVEDIAGEVTWDEIDPKGHFKALSEELQNKTLEDYKKTIVAKKKTIKASLDEIAPRIEENLRSMATEINFQEKEELLANLNTKLSATESNMLDRTQAQQQAMNKIQDHQKKLHEAKTALNNLSFEVYQKLQQEYNEKRSALNESKSKIILLEEALKSKRLLLSTKLEANRMLADQLTELRQEWAKEKAKELVYDESKFSCPTCNRDFEAYNIAEIKETMAENFLVEQDKILASINLRGKNLSNEVAGNDGLIHSLERNIEGLERELAEAQKACEEAGSEQPPIVEILGKNLENNKEYQAAQNLVEELTATMPEVPEIDLSDLKAKKVELTLQIDQLKKELAVRDQIKNAQDRVKELEYQEKKLAQELAELEGKEFTIAEFTKARIDAIESKINGKFKFVSFKMFNTLINGGTEETCETLYKGVPFDSLNTAGKLVAGLDVINTLSDHYGFRAPIFADNRESVTHVIPVNSQLINLIVSPGDAAIRVL